MRVVDPQERDLLWNDVVVAGAPDVATYQAKTTRTIPIARLTPTR